MKKNSRIIRYDHGKERYFMFPDNPIFYREYSSGKHSIITFRNDFLTAEEENNFLRRNSNVKDPPLQRQGRGWEQ